MAPRGRASTARFVSPTGLPPLLLPRRARPEARGIPAGGRRRAHLAPRPGSAGAGATSGLYGDRRPGRAGAGMTLPAPHRLVWRRNARAGYAAGWSFSSGVRASAVCGAKRVPVHR